MPQSYSEDLLAYFTDVENLRDLFRLPCCTGAAQAHPGHSWRWRNREIIALTHVPPALQERSHGRSRSRQETSRSRPLLS